MLIQWNLWHPRSRMLLYWRRLFPMVPPRRCSRVSHEFRHCTCSIFLQSVGAYFEEMLVIILWMPLLFAVGCWLFVSSEVDKYKGVLFLACG